MNPRVSVLMTIYNPGPFLAPAIESLLAQTLPDFELIAVENGSRDGARDIVRGFARDPRIRLIEKDINIGRVPALNLAFGEARADYVAILDADDIAHPDRLAVEAALLDRQPDTIIVGSHVRFIDADGNVTGTFTPDPEPQALLDALAYRNPFAHSSVMYRRQAAVDCGGYDRRYEFANDLALALALVERGKPAMINRFLADIRFHAANASAQPAHYFTRFDEILELFRASMQRPGLSAAATQLGRENLATTHYVYGRELAKAGRPLAALGQLGRMVAADPLYCLQRVGIHAARRVVPKTGIPDVTAR